MSPWRPPVWKGLRPCFGARLAASCRAALSSCLVCALWVVGVGTSVLAAEPARESGSDAKPITPVANGTPVPDPPTARLVPLEVLLNGATAGNWLLLHAPGGFYAPREALDAWRLTPGANGARLAFQHDNWYALASIDGYSARLNEARQSIDLSFSASAFALTQVAADELELPAASAAVPAAFFNYDLSWSHARTGGLFSSRELGALTEAGFTSQWGLLTSSFLGRHVQGQEAAASSTWRRLETTFTRDFPESKFSLRLGDSTTRPGLMGRPIYFGGIQIARNFALAPSFVTQPLPVIGGSSSAPSTVELYINDALRQTLNVPAGPFAIQNPMPMSGDGRARIVVRDVLGRETVIDQTFFTHAELLEDGLSDWSFEMGAVRNNLGLTNADYGQRFASGLWRHGLSKSRTLDLRGEWGSETRGFGVGLSQALPWQALGQASLALSDQKGVGRGVQWSAGGEYNNAEQAASLQLQGASAGYRSVGLNSAMEPAKWQVSGSFSRTHERLGTFGLGWAQIASRSQGRLSTYSLSHSMRVGPGGSLNLIYTQVMGASSARLLAASLVWPLENQINAAFNVAHRSGQTDAYASASQGLRGHTGLGWRVLGGTRNGLALGEADLHFQTARQVFTAGVSTSSAQQMLRVGTQGGFVLMGGRLFPTHQVQDSFALVDVSGIADVGVSFQGRDQARTDSQGQALLTGLQPFNANSIRLNPSDLPLSAEIDSLEQVVVPRLRSAVRLSFPVRTGRAAFITVHLPDGQLAPAGAEVELMDDARRFPVGRNGQVFVTGLQREQQLRLHWKNQHCSFLLALAPGAPNDIARPAPLTCEGTPP